MELKAGTRIRLKHDTLYSHQSIKDGQRYEGTIVATAEEALEGYFKVKPKWLRRDFHVKVVWDWAKDPFDPDAIYYYSFDDLVALSADNNEDALAFLNKEEAW